MSSELIRFDAITNTVCCLETKFKMHIPDRRINETQLTIYICKLRFQSNIGNVIDVILYIC